MKEKHTPKGEKNIQVFTTSSVSKEKLNQNTLFFEKIVGFVSNTELWPTFMATSRPVQLSICASHPNTRSNWQQGNPNPPSYVFAMCRCSSSCTYSRAPHVHLKCTTFIRPNWTVRLFLMSC